MGFLSIGTTVGPAGVTPLTPRPKDVQTKVFKVARTDTSATLKEVLPADASILAIVREAGTASDAATSAGVTLTVANNGGTVSTATDDVKTNGAATGFVSMSALPNLEPRPLNGDLTVTATYAESGTASTTGGPWNYVVLYVR